MLDVLTRAGCFIAIIIAGYVLRKVNFFKEGDFAVLSKREREEYFMQDVGLFPLSVRFIAILGVKYNRWP